MSKWIVAAAMMITAAVAGANREPAPSQDAAEIATGTCSYSCSSNGKTYLNRSQCLAACSGVCFIEAC